MILILSYILNILYTIVENHFVSHLPNHPNGGMPNQPIITLSQLLRPCLVWPTRKMHKQIWWQNKMKLYQIKTPLTTLLKSPCNVRKCELRIPLRKTQFLDISTSKHMSLCQIQPRRNTIKKKRLRENYNLWRSRTLPNVSKHLFFLPTNNHI